MEIQLSFLTSDLDSVEWSAYNALADSQWVVDLCYPLNVRLIWARIAGLYVLGNS